MKKVLSIALSCIILAGVFCGCQKSDKSQALIAPSVADNMSQQKDVANSPTGEAMADGSAVNQNILADQSRKLIRNVDMRAETKKFDDTVKQINEQIAKVLGYVENSNLQGNNAIGENRRWNVTIRIPSKQLDSFLSTLDGTCNVISQNETVSDVTLNFVDLESHVKSLRIEQETLMNFLKEAKDVNQIIQIQQRLTEIRYQIESQESQLRTMQNQVDYSTLNISIDEVEVITKMPAKDSIWSEMAQGFVDGWNSFVDALRKIIVYIVSNIFTLILFAIIVFFSIRIIIKVIDIVRMRKEKPSENKTENDEKEITEITEKETIENKKD